MLNIFHFYKALISDEIKVKITSKIKGIQEVSDWSMFDISSISDYIDFAELDENNVKNERIVWENVAKLSIDLFLDYDYYKKFTFQNDFRGYDYDEKLRKLGFNNLDGYWTSERKPDKETVIRNVFLSCLYRSIELIMKSEKQSLCEQNQTDNECGLNVNNYGDIKVEGAAAANAIGIAGDVELMNCDAGQMNCGAISGSYRGDNGPTTSTDNRINIGELGEVENERRMNDKFEMEKGDKINKYTKMGNENNLMNGGDCAIYGTEILVGEKECSTCQESILGSEIYPIKEINPWNYGDYTFIDQQGNEQRSACKWRKGKIKQNNYKTEVKSKYWQCWYKNCKQMNKSELSYCHNCGLYRYGSAEYGELVKCKMKSGIRDIWICASCHKINDLQDRKCAGKNCHKDRFHKPDSKI